MENDVVVAGAFARLLFGPTADVDPLLFVVVHCIVRREDHSRMSNGVPLIRPEKNNVPPTMVHSDSPNVLCSSISRGRRLRLPALNGGTSSGRSYGAI